MPEKSKALLDLLGVKEESRGWQNLGLGDGGERTMKAVKKGEQLFPAVQAPTLE